MPATCLLLAAGRWLLAAGCCGLLLLLLLPLLPLLPILAAIETVDVLSGMTSMQPSNGIDVGLVQGGEGSTSCPSSHRIIGRSHSLLSRCVPHAYMPCQCDC